MICTKPQKPLEVTVQVDGHQLVMEVDSGWSISVHETYQKFWPDRPLKSSSVNLHTLEIELECWVDLMLMSCTETRMPNSHC